MTRLLTNAFVLTIAILVTTTLITPAVIVPANYIALSAELA